MAVATGSEYGLVINGESVEPATGEPIGRCAMAGEGDIDRAVVAARAAQDVPWGRTPPTERAMEVAQEEIFGPVVTVIPSEDEKDTIRIANDIRYGLFATVWTGDAARGHRVARAIESGMVGIKMPFTAFPGIPFGGYKQSGFGRELSIDTLYLETKGVLVSSSSKPFNPFGL